VVALTAPLYRFLQLDKPLTHRWELNPIPSAKADFANVVVETVAVQPKLGTSPEVLNSDPTTPAPARTNQSTPNTAPEIQPTPVIRPRY